MPGSITHLLIDTVDVTRLLEVSQGHGRWARGTVTVAAGAPFRRFTASTAEWALAQQLRVRVTDAGYCEGDLNVAVGDILIAHSANPMTDGKTYRVTGVQDPSLYQHRKLLLEIVERAEST